MSTLPRLHQVRALSLSLHIWILFSQTNSSRSGRNGHRRTLRALSSCTPHAWATSSRAPKARLYTTDAARAPTFRHSPFGPPVQTHPGPHLCGPLPCISTSRPRHGLHPHNGRTPLALSKGRRAQAHAHKRTPPLAPRPVTRRSCTSRLVAVGMHGRPMPSRKPHSRYPGPAPRLPRSSCSRTGSSPLPKPIIYFLERSQQVQVHYNCSVARQAPRGPAHAKPLDPGHRQAPRTGPTASPSIRVFAKPFKPGQRQELAKCGTFYTIF